MIRAKGKGERLVYLNEREIGFDRERLGFPSVSGCRAIVFQTRHGLFGFHNLGNSDPKTQWGPAAEEFASYVTDHVNRDVGIHLYVVTFVQRGGSYLNSKGKSERSQWQSETEVYAKKLRYKKGPISGYDLSTTATKTSAYVEFRAVGSSCIVLIKPWHRDDAKDGVTKADPNIGPDHKMFKNIQTAKKFVTNVATDDLVQVQPELLRS
jgi:hypothetical protein